MESVSSSATTALNDHLRSGHVDDDLRHLIVDIAIACKHIVREVWRGMAGPSDGVNMFGEKQVALDRFSNEILKHHMRKNELVARYASEEEDQIVTLRDRAPFAVVFDPLDGSSLVDANFAVGTIVGIYAGDILGQRPRDQLAAMYVLYGPRTTLTYSVGPQHGVHEFVLDDIGEFVYQTSYRIDDDARYYAPGNIGAAADSPAYKRLIDSWIKERKTLRYSGCMVPDIHHIFVKRSGVFCNLGGGKYPNGKLRLPFECGPFSFLVEAAGGASSDGKQSILDVEIRRVDQCTPFIVGSKNEVQRVSAALSENAGA
jgi:fructose-1,6-bisphosphatase I